MIPKVFENAKEEYHECLVEHLVHATRLEFSFETSIWMQNNYHRIDEGTFCLCKTIKWGLVKPEYQEASLICHTLVDVHDA